MTERKSRTEPRRARGLPFIALADRRRCFGSPEPSRQLPELGISTPAPQTSTRLILIRHGHIAANTGRRDAPMAGWTDLPLSPQGRQQIERLRQRLLLGARFDAIYSSTLCRATETARLLAAAGLGPLRLCSALREINCGYVDGLSLADVQRRFPELWRENFRQAREDFRWPGGESYREFRDRCVSTVQAIAADHSSGRVAIVTHAGVINQIIGSMRGLSPACWEPFRPGNASVSELAWCGSRGVLVSFDCRAHLAEAL
jgi:broad specificity phosphatase PhoE